MCIIVIVQTNILFVYLQLNGTVLLLLAQSVNLSVQPMYLPGSAVRHHVVYDHEWRSNVEVMDLRLGHSSLCGLRNFEETGRRPTP